jgi:hypothetical protein
MGHTVTCAIAFLLGFAFSRVFPAAADYTKIPNGEIPSQSPGDTTIAGKEIWLGMKESEVKLRLQAVAALEEDKGNMSVIAREGALVGLLATISFGRLDTVDYITRNWGDVQGPQIEPFWSNLFGAIKHSAGDQRLAAVIWADSVNKAGVRLDTIRIEMSGHGVTLVREEDDIQDKIAPKRADFSVAEHLGGKNISMIPNRN